MHSSRVLRSPVSSLHGGWYGGLWFELVVENLEWGRVLGNHSELLSCRVWGFPSLDNFLQPAYTKQTGMAVSLAPWPLCPQKFVIWFRSEAYAICGFVSFLVNCMVLAFQSQQTDPTLSNQWISKTRSNPISGKAKRVSQKGIPWIRIRISSKRPLHLIGLSLVTLT